MTLCDSVRRGAHLQAAHRADPGPGSLVHRHRRGGGKAQVPRATRRLHSPSCSPLCSQLLPLRLWPGEGPRERLYPRGPEEAGCWGGRGASVPTLLG